jgi:hypothetical protein
MVDLMMWLVIAALLLAAALQGIGFYQQRAYIEQMTSDANGAGQIAMAKTSTMGGSLTDAILQEAIKETKTSSGVSLIGTNLGWGYFAIEATHPRVDQHRVIYSFADRNGMKPGVNLTKMQSIDIGGSASSPKCADGTWFAQYYPEYQDEGVPTVNPVAERCETAAISYDWGAGSVPLTGMPVDRFSVHWTKNFEAPEAKEYTFTISSDNKAWVYLDGKQIIDNSRWYEGVTSQTARVQLNPGKHNVTIRYNEMTGGAAINYTQNPN